MHAVLARWRLREAVRYRAVEVESRRGKGSHQRSKHMHGAGGIRSRVCTNQRQKLPWRRIFMSATIPVAHMAGAQRKETEPYRNRRPSAAIKNMTVRSRKSHACRASDIGGKDVDTNAQCRQRSPSQILDCSRYLKQTLILAPHHSSHAPLLLNEIVISESLHRKSTLQLRHPHAIVIVSPTPPHRGAIRGTRRHAVACRGRGGSSCGGVRRGRVWE